ncbi:MAG: ribonuclease domain-containing protein [Chitinophagales bacterium]
MQKRISYFIAFSCLLFVFSCSNNSKVAYDEGFKAGYAKGYESAVNKINENQPTNSIQEIKTPTEDNKQNESLENANPDIPQTALLTLQYILLHHEAPEGYVGGRNFGNYEQHLPKYDKNGKRISYKEWDIHPKVEGKNRGAQRLITGSDGSAWYTADHYSTFKQIHLE